MSDTWRAEVGPARFGIAPEQTESLEERITYRVHDLAAPDGAIRSRWSTCERTVG